MNDRDVENILKELGYSYSPAEITRFCSEEDGKPYDVWKIHASVGTAVLKKVSDREREVYEAFFPDGGGPVPAVYGFSQYGGEQYLLMEYVPGESLSRCTREKLRLTLDALIDMQERFWEDSAHDGVGYGFARCYPNREKRLPYMGDLKEAYQGYLDAFKTLPRTLCNDDMLPFNVLVSNERAVILDWEFAGILPYPCALARLIAFGEEAPDALFQMSREDQAFAVRYYYDNFICRKGISREEYLRTIRLFLLKEYSEWVYCANSSGDLDMPYYKKYYEKARILAEELGFCNGKWCES